jgi:hypothetical protein
LEEYNLIDIARVFTISGLLLDFEIPSKFGLAPHRPTLDTDEGEEGSRQGTGTVEEKVRKSEEGWPGMNL